MLRMGRASETYATITMLGLSEISASGYRSIGLGECDYSMSTGRIEMGCMGRLLTPKHLV